MTRLEQVLRSRREVSLLLNSFTSLRGAAHAGVTATGVASDWPEPNDFAVRASTECRDHIFSHIARIRELANGTSGIQPAGVLGSFAALFAAASGMRHSITEWSEVLGIHAADVALLRSGELSVVEIQPRIAVMLVRILRPTASDFVLLCLGDLGFRPVRVEGGRPILREPVIPRDEVELRLRAIHSAAEISGDRLLTGLR